MGRGFSGMGMKKLIDFICSLAFLGLLSAATLQAANPSFDDLGKVVGGVIVLTASSNLSNTLTNLANNSTLLLGNGDWTNRISYIQAGLGDLGAFHLLNKTNITIRAIGKATLWNIDQGDGLVLSNCSRITIEGVRFFGHRQTNAVQTNLHGTIMVAACRDIFIRGITMDNSSDHFVCEFTSHPANVASSNVVVESSFFYNCGSWWSVGTYDGALVVSDHWTVRNNHFKECAHGVEFYGPNGPIMSGSVIEGNWIENPIRFGINDGGQTNNYHHVIRNNRITFNNATRTVSSNTVADAKGIQLNYPRFYRIEGNYIEGPSTAALGGNEAIIFTGGNWAESISDVAIENNTITNAEIGIVFNESANTKYRAMRVRGNRIYRAYYDPIRVSGTDHVIEDNFIRDSQVNGSGTRGHIWVGPATFSQVATGVVVRGNILAASAGFSPTSAGINIDSGAQNSRMYDNIVPSTYSPRYADSGVNTYWNAGVQARNGGTNLVLIQHYVTIDWPQIPVGSNHATVVTITGATNTDWVEFSADVNTFTNAAAVTNASFRAFASNGTVHVHCKNVGAAGTIDPGNGTNKLLLIKSLATD